MRILSTLQKVIGDMWQFVAVRIVIFGTIVTLLAWRLASLIPVPFTREKQLYDSSTSMNALLDNPLNPVPKVGMFLLRYFNSDTLFSVRLLSVAAAVLLVCLFVYVLRQWFRNPVVMMGIVLIIFSSWFLTMGRQVTPDIYYALILSAGFAYGAWTRTTKHSASAMFIGIGLVLLYAYTPGLIWLALIAIAWQGRTTVRHITDAPKTTVLALTAVTVCLAPLAYAIYKTPDVGLEMLGLSPQPLSAAAESLSRLESVFRTLFYGGPATADTGLVGVAHLDIFTAACLFLGFATIYRWRHLDRQWALVGSFLALLLLITTQGIVPIAALWPIIMIVAVAGLSVLHDRWFTVFPKNPVAKAIGISLFSLSLGLTGYYHIQKYYYAWPQSTETRAIVRARSSDLR